MNQMKGNFVVYQSIHSYTIHIHTKDKQSNRIKQIVYVNNFYSTVKIKPIRSECLKCKKPIAMTSVTYFSNSHSQCR